MLHVAMYSNLINSQDPEVRLEVDPMPEIQIVLNAFVQPFVAQAHHRLLEGAGHEDMEGSICMQTSFPQQIRCLLNHVSQKCVQHMAQ